ncbi:putative uracil-DNA-glycosylase [Leptomonas seymouri]|uniref:Uracil-DNA glycosylase n=1 Tax=Leptomonas seymouri TaxID=5684 RepID=A0A0N1IK50_LEPSE|nr:putative uracil-DNA-glycosylase [Leptomonas seymouri]|eukprot:KPI85855.1 putative uracil-DNA-glycosylase [Leptomonas seymouri]
MQRTLFDFALKKTGAPASPNAAVGAGATASASIARASVPPTFSLERIGDSTSDASTHKRDRPPCESVDSASHPGASREEPIDLEESSVSVVAVDERGDNTANGTASTAAFSSSETQGLMTHARTRRRLSKEKSRSPGRQSRGRLPNLLVPEISTSLTNVFSSSNSRDTVQSTTSSRWLADLITSPEWKSFLQPFTADSWRSGEFAGIERFLDGERAKGAVVLPPAALIFSAFNSCPFAELKVVLLGQDPYHNLNQAHGLCFSVLPGVPLPPSLKNMYKELTTDIPGFEAPTHGYLQSWSEQGMLMLNATLTVEAHKANSHSRTSGWSHFTDAVIARLSQHHPNRIVFLLWGNSAQGKRKLIDTSRHVVIESVHPSPLSASRGWFGCHCFSKCNTALRAMGHTPMCWRLPLQVQRMPTAQ